MSRSPVQIRPAAPLVKILPPRQFHHELRPLPFDALERDLAPEVFDDGLRKVETESAAIRIHLADVLRAEEFFKNSGPLILRNTHTMVFDEDLDCLFMR